MAQLMFDRKDDTLPDLRTTERLKDEFFLCLTSVGEIIVPIESKDHRFCYHYKRPIMWVQEMVDLFGKLIPMDSWGELHKHVFEEPPQ
ncbi:MAG: hypothetical protein M3O24_02075 [Thermoproteota archaeon]|nr:hypothetical protein [Thermoproteota archaeon]